ncbi:MAG: hemerythrin domain-containing protein, partial [Chitinivibrionales bacterium]|nr:hemerythrin domain-containing protein [Chitinivibrionales bacterium]
MQARGPLMVEHRLIERMLALIDKEVKKIEKSGAINHEFINEAVDFIRMYADRTHHGKEEEIFFRELEKKPLSTKDRALMEELIQEHVFGRETTKALLDAHNDYLNGESAAIATIVSSMSALVGCYPNHIMKEDKVFFPDSMAYFSREEDQAMLAEFWGFDRKLIH